MGGADRLPKVSIVIPTYNRAEMLKQALRSVLAQTFTDYEAIVVDDGSTDNTREAVESFRDERVRYVWQENQWLAAARNTGIAHATGDLVAFLDSDDLWFPNMLELLVPAFERYPQAGLVYSSHARVFDDISFPYLQDFVCGREQEMVGNQYHYFLTGDKMGVDEVLVRRELFDKIGGFDRSLRYCEDWNMWLRIAKEADFCYIPGPVSAVRVHQGQMSKDDAGMLECELRQLREFAPADCSREVSESILLTEMNLYARHAYLVLSQDVDQATRWLSHARQIADSLHRPDALMMYLVGYALFDSMYTTEDKKRAAGVLSSCIAELSRQGSKVWARDGVRCFWRFAATHASRLGDFSTALEWLHIMRDQSGLGRDAVKLVVKEGLTVVRSLMSRRRGRAVLPIETLLPRIANGMYGDISAEPPSVCREEHL